MRRFFSHISLLLSFITIGVHSHACICPHPNTLEQNIHDHAFIAHVRIVEKIYSNDTVRNGEIVQIKKTHQGYLKFEIIELFKGDTLSTIKQYDISTSCDIGIYPGEEWILFVWYNSKTNIYSVGACSPSSKFRNAKGERDWRWGIREGYINWLRNYFGHPIPIYQSGPLITYYANGIPESKSYYINGKLCGERNIYYASGTLNLNENYSDGKLDGNYSFYSHTGQLLIQENYVNGKRLKSSQWADTTNHYLFTVYPLYLDDRESKNIDIAIRLVNEYNVIDSVFSTYRWYDITGVLTGESIINDRDSISIHKNYFLSGELKYVLTNFTRENKVTYQQWDKNGNLELDQTRINGKIVEDRLKKNKEP